MWFSWDDGHGKVWLSRACLRFGARPGHGDGGFTPISGILPAAGGALTGARRVRTWPRLPYNWPMASGWAAVRRETGLPAERSIPAEKRGHASVPFGWAGA